MPKIENSKLKIENLLPRPPIVVVMGHVDHGKSSLLDFIRKTNIVAKEAGGITQSIGAYEVEHHSTSSGQAKLITFIDTPGHEAFFKMRSRGAKAADLAILVVAADDGVKPQTLESIKILNLANTPFIVAINKIDKPNADIEKIKNDLTANGVLLEGYGGNVSWQAISAKTGEGVNELLDLILLSAEMENLTYDPKEKAQGFIIEAKTDSSLGNIAIAIVKNGVLKVGDLIATPTVIGKIKILENFLSKKVKKLEPSAPALISAFDNLPQIGEEFIAGHDIDVETERKIVPEIAKNKIAAHLPTLNLIIKADVSGSLETLSEIIRNIKYENVGINVINESIGEITDGDVKSALSCRAIILGFKTKSTKIAERLAKDQNIKIIVSEIIYELIEAINNEAKLIEKPQPLAEAEILKIFSQKGKKQLIGGKVLFGSIKKNSRLKILRNNEEIGMGKVLNLKRQKQEINETKENEECGIMFESDVQINEGDR
ncbi:MAG: translation initiation factor IF-2, partial [Patescibacteria group bacterium]